METNSKVQLTPEQIAARRAYKRRWNAEHPEKAAEYQRRFWQKKYQEQAQEHRQEAK